MAKQVWPKELGEYMRRIGRKGGKTRLTSLTPEQRTEIARKAGKAGGRGRGKKRGKKAGVKAEAK
jgi:general stress protein YciG